MSSADPVFLEWRDRPSRDNLRRLLQSNQDRVYSLCHQVLRHEQDAEDAAQASLLEVAQGVLRLRDPRAFNSWLYRVCLNNALNLRRDRLRRREREERSAALVSTSPDDRLRDAVHDAIARLNDEDRALVVEHYFEKETLEDLGARRGISGVAAWKRIEQAKERMKRALAGVGTIQMNAVLEAAEPVPAPSGFSVDAALLRKDLSPPIAPRIPVRILGVAAAAVVATIITAVVIANRSDPETTASTVLPPSKPLPIPEASPPEPKPVPPPPPQDTASRVLGPDGHPVQGALVFPGRWYRLRGDDAFDLFRPQTIKDGVTTDEEGRYALATDRPFITAWHAEFSPTTVAKSDAGTIRMRARGAIRGRVVDSSGQPVEGIAITLDKRGPKTTTDGEGRFEFDHVIAGCRGLILSDSRRIAVRVDPAETVNVDIGPGVDVTLDLSGHPRGPGIEINGGLMGTGRTTSLLVARGRTPHVEVKGVLPGRYLYGEIRLGPRGWVEITGKEAKVAFGSSTLEVTSDTSVSFHLVPAGCNEIMEVALMKDGPLKAGPGETAKVSHLLEGEYEIRDLEGATVRKFTIGPGETRIALTSK